MEPSALHDILAESGCEIQSMNQTPGGNKVYQKASKEQFVETAKHVNDVGKVHEFLKDYSFGDRYQWIQNTKDEGNKFYAQKLYGKALDKYLSALYGMNFPDKTLEMEKKVNIGLKVPLLNNMAICLL
mmetsp:Transcript_8093/g.7164  ORF Transcript_8093/g.7164 Transcript_8093/m.7164 type:complete len:128 (+) Transcript_8093:2-385(+)